MVSETAHAAASSRVASYVRSRLVAGAIVLSTTVGTGAACTQGSSSGDGGRRASQDGSVAPDAKTDGGLAFAAAAGTTPDAGASGSNKGGARTRFGARIKPQDLLGLWYLNRDGERLVLSFASDAAAGSVNGTSTVEIGASRPSVVDTVVADASGRNLSWCAHEQAGDVWYAVRVQEGVLAGRYARVLAGASKPAPTAYKGRVTGWRQETFSQDIVPRVFDILADDGSEAVLRIDRSGPGASDFTGSFKHFAKQGGLDEMLAEDVQIERWDGVNLSFLRPLSPSQDRFTGAASGRTISGTVSATAGPSAGTVVSWKGSRIEVLSHGLGSKTAAALSDWQSRARARLALLMMAGDPAPLTLQVTTMASVAPTPDYDGLVRDDAPGAWPQLYTLTELAFDGTVPGIFAGSPLVRHAHGYLAVPTTPPPAGGYPVVLALNGHGGSAHAVFDPGGMYWYGDAFARRGYLVVSVDIGHRPLADRADYYTDVLDGDDAQAGNGPHPAIEVSGMTSDWEEDGERTWDAMRALDFALARHDIDQRRVVVAGLSMGGEISDWVSALDVRVGAAFAAGSPADLAVMALHLNHPCWRWQRADVREYLDPGDLAALAAPRTMVRETGILDPTYSDLPSPFAAAKELVRRAKPAYDALGGTLVHYLHDEGHVFRVGDYAPAVGASPGVTTPVTAAPEPASWSDAWEADAATIEMARTIFDILPN